MQSNSYCHNLYMQKMKIAKCMMKNSRKSIMRSMKSSHFRHHHYYSLKI